MNFALGPSTVFLTLAGSQAHGTAREGSDIDLRGVCVTPLEERFSLFRHFEQFDGLLPADLHAVVHHRLAPHPTAGQALKGKIECVIYDIEKYLRLCANANPSALEILFSDPRDWVLDQPDWVRLYEVRHAFLTKRVQQTFQGYALAQLKKIKTHRSWLLNPPAKKPEREDFALPRAGGTLSRDDQNRIEKSIADKIRTYGVDDIEMPKASRIAVHERLEGFYRDVLAADSEVEAHMRAVATHALQIPEGVAAALNAERKYRAAMKHWESYRSWKSARNPRRADLERRHGYDTKHAMHLVRLMRMGLEVLEQGELFVRREDAEELLAIRDGALSYEALIDEAEGLQDKMSAAALSTKLPAALDEAYLDELLVDLLT